MENPRRSSWETNIDTISKLSVLLDKLIIRD